MEEQDPGQWKRTVIDASAGAIAGGISRTVTSPLDVIKIRFQVSNFLYSFSCFNHSYNWILWEKKKSENLFSFVLFVKIN